MRLLSWIEQYPIYYIGQRAGYNINLYHKLETWEDKKREVVAAEVEKLQAIKFAASVCCKLCAVLQEMCEESIDFDRQSKGKCLYEGIVYEAVVAIIVVSRNAIVNKIYAWMWSEGTWTENTALSEEEAKQVT